MRLVLATQVVDLDDPNLAQTVDLVEALAARCASVAVVCDRVGRHRLPSNVSFSTFGSASRLGRGLAFQRALAGAVRGGRPDAVLAHMVPLFLVLAGPLAKALRIPLLLWYTHWNADRSLRAAARLADVVLSVDERSFPVASPKVRGIGHAIDLRRFAARDAPPPCDGRLRLLALGKTEPWKGFPVLLDAVERAAGAGVDVRLELRGPQLTERQRLHREALEARVRASATLRGRVAVLDAVGRDEVPGLVRAADAVVSPSAERGGAEALDKVVYESAACAVPVLACNPSLEPVLAPHGLFFRGGDPDDLAEKLLALARTGPAQRAETGQRLRRWVEERHSLDGWADAVVAAVGDARR